MSDIAETITQTLTSLDTPVAEAPVLEDNIPVLEEGSAAPEAAEPEKKVEEPKQEDAFSKKFAALSKKEKAIRQRETQLNAKMAELEAKLKALETPKEAPKAPVKDPLEIRLKRSKNPLEVLAEEGLSYEMLTQLALNDGKLPPEMQMKLMQEELDNKYKTEIENLRKEMQEKEITKAKEEEERVLNNFKNELQEFVNSNEDYELIRANNASHLVFEVIDAHFNKTGRVLSNKEAADAVESHLEQEALKLYELKKLKSKLGQQPSLKKEPEVKKSTPTLSNSQTATLSGAHKNVLSAEESKVEAAKLIRWDD